MSADLRALAVEAYNEAYDVVESGVEAEHARAIELSAASLHLWRRVPTCTEKNLAIGCWLYARALSKAGAGGVAVAVAGQAMNHMNNMKDPAPSLWLTASILEGWARALVAAGDEPQRALVALEEAAQAIEAIADDKNKDIISAQFADLRAHLHLVKPKIASNSSSSSKNSSSSSSSSSSLSDISSLLLIANHHLKTNSLDKAERVLRQGIAQFPSDFRVHFNLASCLCRQRGQDDQQQEQRATEAMRCFERVVALDPSVLEAYGCLSGLHIKMQEAEKALEWCKRGLEIDEKDSTCLFNANVALRLLDRLHDAVALTLVSIDTSSSSSSSSSSSLFSSLASASMPNIVLLKLKQQETQEEEKGKGAEQQQEQKKREEERDENDRVTIVCVKWGKKYSAHYVNVLYTSLLRHWNSNSSSRSSSSGESPPLRLVCLTDDANGIDERVECKPFHAATQAAKWQGWWLKANLFCPSLALIGHIVYLDLDTVLCGPIDFLWSTPLPSSAASTAAAAAAPFAPRIAILAAASLAMEGRVCGVNSSIMVWHSSSTTSLAPLFSFLLSHYSHVTKCICKFDHYLETMLMSMPSKATVDGSTYPLSFFLASSSSPPPSSSSPSSSSSSSFDEGVQEEEALVLIQHEKRIQDYRTFASTSSSSLGSSGHTNILCFPLLPKPHQVVEDATCFVSHHWRL